MKSALYKITGILLLLGSLAFAWLWMDYQSFLTSPLGLATPKVTVQVDPGTSMKQLVQQLVKQDVIQHPFYLTWHARLTNKAHKLRAGEYTLTPEMTPVELLDTLISGKVVQYSLTIVEGWNIWQLLEAVANDKTLTHTLDDNDPNKLMARLGYPNEHPEGRFLPDTYFFPRHTTDIDFLRRAYDSMKHELTQQWPSRQTGLPLATPDEALILASIVEKETGLAEERPRIAGVFIRRLQQGMRLQTDPTIIYGLGRLFDGNLRRKDLRQDNPYNSYTRKGLPPTPIAMPGKEAIAAVLHPADGDEIFFVAKGDGSHYFSSSLAEHNGAVIKYQLSGRARRVSTNQ